MTRSSSVYQDILSQGQALQQTLDYQSAAGAQTARQQAAQAIRRAQRVAVIGIGASYAAAAAFSYRLAAAGVQITLEDAAEFLHYTHPAYPPGSAFVIVSRSGASIEIVRALELLKAQGQFTVGVTNEPGSPLAQRCDLALPIGGPTDMLISIQTYVTSLLALHFLAEAVLAIPLAQSLPPVHAMLAAVQETIDRYQALSAGWGERLPQGQALPFQALYWLGRGASLSTVLEAALLSHEMARFPGLAYSAGAFRHGPWEVVDAHIRAILFAPPDQTLALNLALAADLKHLGGQVTLVTAAAADLPAAVDVWRLPGADLPAYLDPFLEIIPAEFYLHTLALAQGLTPGVFRASTQITLAESGTLR